MKNIFGSSLVVACALPMTYSMRSPREDQGFSETHGVHCMVLVQSEEVFATQRKSISQADSVACAMAVSCRRIV